VEPILAESSPHLHTPLFTFHFPISLSMPTSLKWFLPFPIKSLHTYLIALCMLYVLPNSSSELWSTKKQHTRLFNILNYGQTEPFGWHLSECGQLKQNHGWKPWNGTIWQCLIKSMQN